MRLEEQRSKIDKVGSCTDTGRRWGSSSWREPGASWRYLSRLPWSRSGWSVSILPGTSRRRSKLCKYRKLREKNYLKFTKMGKTVEIHSLKFYLLNLRRSMLQIISYHEIFYLFFTWCVNILGWIHLLQSYDKQELPSASILSIHPSDPWKYEILIFFIVHSWVTLDV